LFASFWGALDADAMTARNRVLLLLTVPLATSQGGLLRKQALARGAVPG